MGQGVYGGQPQPRSVFGGLEGGAVGQGVVLRGRGRLWGSGVGSMGQHWGVMGQNWGGLQGRIGGLWGRIGGVCRAELGGVYRAELEGYGAGLEVPWGTTREPRALECFSGGPSNGSRGSGGPAVGQGRGSGPGGGTHR